MAKEVTKTVIKEITTTHPKHSKTRTKIPRPKKKSIRTRRSKTSTTTNLNKLPGLEKTIVENLIALQKAQTNLTEKFDSVSKQLSELLTLFEMAARSFATNPAVQASEKDKEFLDKVDKLLEQNKTIAKGLTLMEERARERVFGQEIQQHDIRNPSHEVLEKPKEKNNEKPGFEQSMRDPDRPLPKF